MNTSTNWLTLWPRARTLGSLPVLSALLIAASASCTGGGGEGEYQPATSWPVAAPDAGDATGGTSGAASAPVPTASAPSGWPASGGAGTVNGAGGASSGAATGGTVTAPVGTAAGGATAAASARAGSGGLTGAGATAGDVGGFAAGLAGFGGLTGVTGGGAVMPAMPLDPSVKQPDPSKLPKVKGTCPNLDHDGSVTFNGSTAQLWVGSKPGPVYFYWHGTGGSPSEVDQALPGATAGTKTNGGLVASWETSNEQGESTGSIWAVWYMGDLEAADQILACALEKGIVDSGRIHTSGYSAGGLQAGAMLFARSNYLASGIVYSGGKGFGATRLQDPSNAPSLLGAHGAQGSDSLILDFHDWTMDLERELKQLGAFAMDCDDNGSHIDFAFGRAGVGGKAMQFLKDHPYNTKPSPYAGGLPAGYPSYCKVVQ